MQFLDVLGLSVRSVCWGGEKILAGTNGGEIFEITAADKEKPVTLVQVRLALKIIWSGLRPVGGGGLKLLNKHNFDVMHKKEILMQGLLTRTVHRLPRYGVVNQLSISTTC